VRSIKILGTLWPFYKVISTYMKIDIWANRITVFNSSDDLFFVLWVIRRFRHTSVRDVIEVMQEETS